jgi:hypothetical protein
VLDARAFPGEGNLAYGLLISGLARLLSQPGSSRKLLDVPQNWLLEGARLLPEIYQLSPGLPTAPAMAGPGGQTRFFEGLRQIIFSLLRGPLPGIFFLEDLQWADSASLEFLRYLIRRLEGQELIILATWLEHSLPETLQQIIGESQRRGNLTRVKLQRLAQEDLTDLVRVATHKYPDSPPDLAERLFQETEGLPFFAIEYLEAIVTNLEKHTLEPGDLSKASARTWDIPDAVRDALLTRASAAGETGWQVLSTAAVIGRSFDFDTLLAASGRNEAEAISALEKLINLGLIDEQTGRKVGSICYDFTHDQIRRLAYEETTLTRRRLIHRRVADALAGQIRRRSDARMLANQAAYHYQQAGLDAQAAEYFLLAANYARVVFANQQAILNFQAALISGHPDAALIHEAIGDLSTLQGDYRTALTEYETTAALVGSSAHLEQKIGNLHHRRGEWELAACHYQLALETEEACKHPEIAAQILADWSLTAHHLGQEDAALEYASKSLQLATGAGATPALASAYNILGILARRSGRPQVAIQHLRESLLLAQQLNDPDAQISALNNLSLASQDADDLGEAIRYAQEALTLCRSRGDRHREAALLNHLADLYHLIDDAPHAMSYLKEAVMIFSEIGTTEGGLLPEIWKLTEW